MQIPEIIDTRTLRDNKLVLVTIILVLVAMATRIIFWLYTDRVWEDALITVLHSENLANGLGLTHYRTGQPPIHGFTSPLSVLIPIIGDLFSVGQGINFLKFISVLSGGGTVLYMIAIASHHKINLPKPLIIMIAGFTALEHHQILWGMAGMETQVVTMILVMTLYYLLVWNPTAIGITLGLSMLARPDFVLLVGVAYIYCFFRDKTSLIRITSIMLIIYGPWLLFTYIYYGTLIPHTITAKSLSFGFLWHKYDITMSVIVKRLVWYFFDSTFLPLGPSFGGHGTGFQKLYDHGITAYTLLVFLVAGIVGIIIKRNTAFITILAFFIIYSLYLIFITSRIMPWYVVPYLVVTVLIVAYGINNISEAAFPSKYRNTILSSFVFFYLLLIVSALPITFESERLIQQNIEDKVRKQIGLDLHDMMGPDESVGAEPLGYLSYYSRKTVYDYPGLANRKVTKYMERIPRKYRKMNIMLGHFRPDYLLLRNDEYELFLTAKYSSWLTEKYKIIKEYSADLKSLKGLYHINQNRDLNFLLLKKISD